MYHCETEALLYDPEEQHVNLCLLSARKKTLHSAFHVHFASEKRKKDHLLAQ